MTKTVNEYMKDQKALTMLKAKIRAEVTEELIPTLTEELIPKIRLQVLTEIELNYFLMPKTKESVNIDSFIKLVINEVSEAFKITQYEVLVSKSRVSPLPDARGAIAYICRTMKPVTNNAIARALNKHHATTIHGKRQCENLMHSDKQYKALIEQIIKSVNDKI